MNRRTNMLARLRRWKTGAARYVVGSVAVAYLSAGMAPCAMATSHDPNTLAPEQASLAHAGHAQHEQRDHAAHSQHDHAAHGGNAAAHDSVPAPADNRGEHCPHCPHRTNGDAPIACDDVHASCLALDDLTKVSASKAKDAPQPLAPPFGPAAFTLPPPLASPRAPPPLRSVAFAPVPLNVRHCVFLI